jgi:hypothetical protein
MCQRRVFDWLPLYFLVVSVFLHADLTEGENKSALKDEVTILIDRLERQAQTDRYSQEDDDIELRNSLWKDLQECWSLLQRFENVGSWEGKKQLEIPLRKISHFQYRHDGHTIDNDALAKIVFLCPNLQILDLSCSACLTDVALTHLTALPNLQWLSLNGAKKITDEGIAYLSKVSSLTSLDLGWCLNITDCGLNYLGETALQSLHLGGCHQITDNGIAYLARLPLLSLSLNNTQITDCGLSYLTAMPLTRLYLAACNKITDAGLDCLIGLPLQSLGLNHCPQVTDAKRATLQMMGIYIH